MLKPREIFETGYDRGYSIAQNNFDPNNDYDEQMYNLWEGESNDRSFSPFELWAREMNETANNPECKFDPWKIFEKGINEGMMAAIKEQTPIHLQSQHTITRNDIPLQCIEECTQQGDVTESVKHWVSKLQFTVNYQDARNYLLNEVGIESVKDSQEATEFILWIACGTLRDNMTFSMGV